MSQLFKQLPHFKRKIDLADVHAATNIVRPRQLYVATVENSLRTIEVVMSLYATHGAYPEPHQIVFCHQFTEWEELELLLLRCFHGERNGQSGSLLCIANIEYHYHTC